MPQTNKKEELVQFLRSYFKDKSPLSIALSNNLEGLYPLQFQNLNIFIAKW